MANVSGKLDVQCDHKGEGLYWCCQCVPSNRELSEWLGLAIQQRDRLMRAVRNAMSSLSQSATYEVPPIVIRDVADTLNRLNQELNLP